MIRYERQSDFENYPDLDSYYHYEEEKKKIFVLIILIDISCSDRKKMIELTSNID
jgi:hypothetical protein